MYIIKSVKNIGVNFINYNFEDIKKANIRPEKFDVVVHCSANPIFGNGKNYYIENYLKTKKIVDFFGYDNETLFSVKLKENNVPVQWLDNNWHYFFDTQGFIPDKVKFVHTINKDFKVVWRKYSA